MWLPEEKFQLYPAIQIHVGTFWYIMDNRSGSFYFSSYPLILSGQQNATILFSSPHPFFFFNLVWLNLMITLGKSTKNFPFKSNSANTSSLWLVRAIHPAFSLHAHKCNDTTTRTVCSISRRRMVQLFLVTTPERTARKHWSSGLHGRGLLPFPKCSNIEGLLLSEGHRYYCCRVISLSQAEIGVGSCLLFIYPSNSQLGFFEDQDLLQFLSLSIYKIFC